jgi:hypothetical protein
MYNFLMLKKLPSLGALHEVGELKSLLSIPRTENVMKRGAAMRGGGGRSAAPFCVLLRLKRRLRTRVAKIHYFK